MKTFKTPKGTELPMADLRGKDYLLVAHRLVWFREEHPDWAIETSVTHNFEKQYCVARAEISDNTGRLIATATKVEDRAGFGDYVEKSETGAIGRALALCGYGTQFAPDLDEGERIVDAPLKSPQRANPPNGSASAVSGSVSPPANGSGQTGSPGKVILVPFGRNKGKPISSLRVDEMENDLAYWITRAEREGKPLGGAVKEYVDALQALLPKVVQLPQEGDVPAFHWEGPGTGQ